MGKFEDFLERQCSLNAEMFRSRFYQIAFQRYVWENLPEGLESEQLEKFIQTKGGVVVFKEEIEVKGIGTKVLSPVMFLPIVEKSDWNLYDTPQMVGGINRGIGKTGIPIEDCVLIRNNFLMQPSTCWIDYYCDKMANIDNARDLNINASKTPFLLTVQDGKERLTIQNYFRSINISNPLILIDQNSIIENQGKQVLNTGVTLETDKYQQAFIDYRNELLTYLGINNVQIEKRERLTNPEIDSNNEFIEDNILAGLVERKKACKLINEKFGLNLNVEFRKYKTNEIKNNEEGENEVNDEILLYNNSSRDE